MYMDRICLYTTRKCCLSTNIMIHPLIQLVNPFVKFDNIIQMNEVVALPNFIEN